ncbi:TBC1 domain family member 2B [Latimeria chalumnae]|uniref:TBC1 domain family member 2B n=1 Tax=Latimeria chalumnae TaxID=7897 RepID=H2ZUP5_LATCH|nr:PREDICTED: TBC1 domain family member 2B [Latimeria chalumnae]|eukprot:XP_005987763.1 PREDICTED: TBC1 domain family member 2B [Latimeria chalumnae]
MPGGGEENGENAARSSRLPPDGNPDPVGCEAGKEQPPKLCGFLAKQTGKGPLKGFKRRWFVFDPRKCYLYYFRTPQDALPLAYITIGDACFTYDLEAEEGQFEIHSSGRDYILKAPNKKVMRYWLQQLQQKRWEYCNNHGAVTRDNTMSPTLPDVSTGLVAKDSDCTSILQPNESAETARNFLAVETTSDGLVGEHAASYQPPIQATTINFSLKHWGTEIRNSMSHLRPGKGNSENRKSVFYTCEEWEMLDPTNKDLEDSAAQEEKRKSLFEGSKAQAGSAFTFDFGRSSSRGRRPFLKDFIGSNKSRNSSDTSPVEWTSSDGSKASSELQLKMQSLQEELTRKTEETTNQKELIRLLQQTLRSSHSDRRPFNTAATENSQNNAEALPDKDHIIQGLNNQLEKVNLEKDSLQQEVKNLKIKIGELNDQLNMLMETIQAKDEVLMKLSKQLSECENNLPSQGGVTDAPISSPLYKELQELDKLKDNLQGYQSQNKFLNKEILELSLLRKNAEARERAMQTKYTNLEATLCQTESKYLVLLQEVKKPVCSGEQGPEHEVISRLLEDALKVESPEQPEQTILKPHPVSEYDIHGFKTVPEDDEEETLIAKVRALDLRSLSISEKQEVSINVKWENYFASTMNREMVRSPELKNLIRWGIPHEHRSKVWKWCISIHVKKFKDGFCPGYFDSLLKKALEMQNPASKQIELDLMRTLPNNKHYASPTSEGIQKLRNVLLAFSWRNPDIGYCQGLNRLAAIALLYLEQEDSFWCLVTIVEIFMPRDYYTKTLLGSQVDQRVFKDLMCEKLPRLYAHFEQYKVDTSLITFNWFLVVFVDSVVSDILFKIWDSFLYEGPKVIFRFALALFKYKEEEILKLQDSMSIFKYLRYFTRTILDARKLASIAFGDMNPFPKRQIHNRRTFHLEKVRLELTELEAIRQDFLRERETNQERRDLISDDEDDN